ncbi:MAG TPA: peptidoglycan DD-metalloendopeptidase family protein [Chthonomonadaceae bacterium]|nr:peptidoglycan DD-metalloendopeptidase family protein [Chthonomonadaceae bacterium]
MRFISPKLCLRLALGGALVALLLGAAISAPSHGAKHKKPGKRATKRVLSAQEARVASVRKAQLRRKLRGMSSHIHQVRAKIHHAKVQENQISESIQTVEARLERTRRNLARTDARLEVLDAQHTRTVKRLEATQQRLAMRRRLLGQRIRYNYERGQTTYAQVLVASRSVHELLSRGYYVRQIVHSEEELIKGVRADIKQIEADKRELEAQEREQRALAAQFQAEKEQYAADRERKQELLQDVHEARVEAEEELDELENEANAMTDRIRALSEALQLRREAMRQARRSRPRLPHAPREQAEEPIPPVWRGGFIRPVIGPITSGFGSRFHPILHRRKMHTGIDFGAGYGAPIHAAGGGTVILAAYTRGYGNCVIIDHGNGVTTLYGHCSALMVSEGQVVHQGQTIARVGSTGMSTGPHLHFEVRRNGVPVPPF